MRWRTGRRSQNVEDRRGMGSAGMRGMRFPVGIRLPGGGGRGGGARGAGIGGGIGLIVLVLAALFLGVDPGILFDEEPGGAPTSAVTAPPRSGADGELADFVSVVLGDTEDTWRDLFQGMGRTYREPTLVLFSDAAESACGLGQAAMGPFYCPGDERVYIDLAFFEELGSRFGAPGDFAQAYVIAHEVGHHVQNLLGISEQVHAARLSSDPAEANDLSVRLELQADCFAGVWARHAHESRQVLE
ncbi:MAG TPA: neutral zinc metallopeptidase, partial [Geminicoccaceae bacterium]|nr:neutral zinc metallopeptidase [Geminicoccaceae bacterium]